jgi:hypothetical protein
MVDAMRSESKPLPAKFSWLSYFDNGCRRKATAQTEA